MSVTVDVDAGGSVTVDVDENAGGPAGGVLAGNYPDPGFAVPMATEAELTAHEAAHPAHPASGVSVASGAGVTATDVQAAIAQIVGFITSQEAGDSAAIAAVAASLADEITRATTVEAAKQAHDADLDAIAALDSTLAGALASDGAGWIRKTYAQLKTALTLVKGDVGLGNVDNTSDANKPVSTAQAAADATKLVRGVTSGFANLAALPAASAHTGEVVKTDDAGVYESTGSSWVQLVPPNGTYELHPAGGTDGQVLTKDSTAPTGNKWAPAGGAGGSDANFVFQQASPSASWTVIHNLAKRPCVDIVDASGNVVLADIQYLSDNALVVSFSAAIAGAAYVN